MLPSDCALCAGPLDHLSRVPVCTACLDSLAPQDNTGLCRYCATRLEPDSFIARQYDVCDECGEKTPAFERVIAYGEYSGALRELIHLVKFSAVIPATRLLAGKMAEALAPLREELPTPLLLTAVPLFGAREKQRGFNQSRLLAMELARILRRNGWSVQEDYLLLSRSRATKSQSELNIRQRRANLRGVFALGEHAEAVRGANILLVDDIVTTGTTARQCANVLKRNKAAGVWVVAAARSQRQDTVGWEAQPGSWSGGVQ